MSLERMSSKDLLTIRPDATVLEAAKLMQSKSMSPLIVVENSQPVGIITEKDIVNVVANEKKPAKTSVEMVMTSNPRIINIAYEVLERLRLMHTLANVGDKDNREWLVECPFTGTLADTYIRPLKVPLSRLIEIRSCSRWREKEYCGQECVENTRAFSGNGVP